MLKRNLLAAGLALGLTSLSAHALDATLTWTAPTSYTDDTPIPAGKVITYKIYDRLGLLNSVVGATTFYIGSYVADRNCWTITATIDGVESAKTPEGCKGKTPRAPGAPVVK